MEDVLIKVGGILLSEYGAVALLLLAAVIYQTRELKGSRRNNDTLHGQILELATKQITAMKEFQTTLDKVLAIAQLRRPNGD